MCDFLQKTEQIRSGGSEPAQYAELTALLGNALRFAVYVHKFVVKACVIVVTEMLSIERAERARWVVTRENWAKVQENLRSMQTTMSIELPHEISLSHNSRFQRTCGVFCRVETKRRREIYARMLREMPTFSLTQMETDLLALLGTGHGKRLSNASQNVEKLCNVAGALRPKQAKKKEVSPSSESLQPPVPPAQGAMKELAGTKGNNAVKGRKRPVSPERGGTQNSAGLIRSSRSRRDSGPCPVAAEVARRWHDSVVDRPDWERGKAHDEAGLIQINEEVMRLKMLDSFVSVGVGWAGGQKGNASASVAVLPVVGGHFRLRTGERIAHTRTHAHSTRVSLAIKLYSGYILRL